MKQLTRKSHVQNKNHYISRKRKKPQWYEEEKNKEHRCDMTIYNEEYFEMIMNKGTKLM